MTRSIAGLGLAADLRAEPWTYPGPFLPFSCKQIGTELVELEEPVDLDPDACHFVIAIGSNASPDVMRRKFERGDVSTTVPHLLARLDGVAIGYSAHVSMSGYVAATPYPRPGTLTEVVVSALTDEQLACLDATEPNYVRMTVPSTAVVPRLPVPLPAELYLYESKWGVLVDEEREPLEFGNQYAIFDRLAAWGLLPEPLTITDGVEHLTKTLGEQPILRERIREGLAAHAVRSRQEAAD